MQRTAIPAPARSRRSRTGRFAALTVVAGLIAALTACSSDSDATPTESTSSAADSGSTAAVFPATVATKFGDVTIDKKPERVVALGWGDAETALALGVQPVGASDWLAFGGSGVGPWATDLYTTPPTLIGTLEPEFEKIAALKPDLILDTKSSGDQKRYDTLSKIAPTVGVPEGGDQYKLSWEQQTTMVSTALGLAQGGQKLIDDTKAKFATAVTEHPEFKGKTITVGSRTSEGYGAYVRGTGRLDFVERLGFANNPAVQEKADAGFSISVSRENLKILDADLLVMAPIGIDAKEISEDPLYQALPAVKAGHSVVFDDALLSQAFATETPLSVAYALEKVVPLFTAALTGSTSTPAPSAS